jgi:energy-converting hydrogenase Eha subunit A
MSFFSHLNWLAIVVATIAYFAIGAIWYTPAVFGKKWMELLKIDPTKMDRSGMGMMMAQSFVTTLIVCTGLSVLSHLIGLWGAMEGLKLGVLCGVCFALCTNYIVSIFEKRPFMLVLINGGYNVAGMVAASIIICIWS